MAKRNSNQEQPKRFWWPDVNETAAIEISDRELAWLLEGLDITQVKAHKITDLSLI